MKSILFMVYYVAPGIIFSVLEPPIPFTGTRHARSCLIIIINIATREHPRAGSKQMATYQAEVAQAQSSSSSPNLCCSVATQTWSAHHVACSLLHTIHYASSSVSTIGGGGDSTIFSPGRLPKQPLPGIGLHDPLHGRQACPEFNSYLQRVGQISLQEGLFLCRPLPKRGQMCDTPAPLTC